MAKTLTDIGIQKIGQRFVDSVDHAAFTLNGQPKTVQAIPKNRQRLRREGVCLLR